MRVELLSLDSPTQRIWEDFSEEYFPHICNSYAWQSAAKKSYFAKEKAQVITFYSGEKLVGLLPILRSKATFMRLPTSRYHSFEQSINFSDVMILPNYLEEVLAMLLKNHRRYFPNSSFVKLTVSKNNNPDINQILKRSGEFIKPLVLDRQSRIIELRNGEDFFQGLLPKKRRTNHRRAIKLLSQIGLLTTEHLQPAREEAVNESWKRFLAIYRQSWKHTSARSITGTLAEHNFFHQIFRRFSREQKLYCSFLKLNDMDIAVSWSVKHGNTCYGLQTAYITDYENASPGAICMTEHLIDYFSHSGKRFDLMGEHPYKNKISNLATSYCDYYLFFNGPYSTILHKLSRFSPLPFRQL